MIHIRLWCASLSDYLSGNWSSLDKTAYFLHKNENFQVRYRSDPLSLSGLSALTSFIHFFIQLTCTEHLLLLMGAHIRIKIILVLKEFVFDTGERHMWKRPSEQSLTLPRTDQMKCSGVDDQRRHRGRNALKGSVTGDRTWTWRKVGASTLGWSTAYSQKNIWLPPAPCISLELCYQ